VPKYRNIMSYTKSGYFIPPLSSRRGGGTKKVELVVPDKSSSIVLECEFCDREIEVPFSTEEFNDRETSQELQEFLEKIEEPRCPAVLGSLLEEPPHFFREPYNSNTLVSSDSDDNDEGFLFPVPDWQDGCEMSLSSFENFGGVDFSNMSACFKDISHFEDIRLRACLMQSAEFRASAKKGKRGKMKGRSRNRGNMMGGRQNFQAQERARIQLLPPRYIDTTITGSIVGTGSLNQITDVAQGVAQGQRTGDRIVVDRFIWNYTLYQENADVVNTVRLMVVQFVPNTTLLSGAVTDFLQSASPTSLYNHELRENYFILYDRVYRMAGTSTNPTSTSAIGRQNVIIRPRRRTLDFTLGSTAGGVNQCFVLLIGDSTVVPYASITSVIRMVYRNP